MIMGRELDPNFKRVFSFELLLHRIENTKSENEQYTKILLEKSLAGLDAQGKILIDYTETLDDYVIRPVNESEENKRIANKLTNARKIYKDLAQKMGSARSDVTGRSWTDGQVLEMCHLIDAVIYPIAMSENLLDMSVTLEDFSNQIAAANKGKDDDE
jgi:uncharacterized protein YeeX (DUF496 family)